MIPIIIIGNPDNRRVSDFLKAAHAEGGTPPIVFSHAELLDDLTPLLKAPQGPHWVRIDAVGEDAEVERRLLTLGYDGGALDPQTLATRAWRFGELLAPAQLHRGLLRYLRSLDEVLAARAQWRPLSPIASIVRLFDKAATWRLHKDAGLPVPEALEAPVDSPDMLRAAMRARGWRTAYVKMACGSSASGLGVFMTEPTERLMTTLTRHDGGWFNSLRVQRLSRPEQIEAALSFILEQGAHVEKAAPKARLDGAWFDLRVLVIDGAAPFTVVRQSRHPITNLHLGGWRGDLASLVRAAPPGALDAAYETCKAAAKLQGCFHVGLDLLFTPRLNTHRVIEANAFGDLLPNVSFEGRSVYAHQVHRLNLRR